MSGQQPNQGINNWNVTQDQVPVQGTDAYNQYCQQWAAFTQATYAPPAAPSSYDSWVNFYSDKQGGVAEPAVSYPQPSNSFPSYSSMAGKTPSYSSIVESQKKEIPSWKRKTAVPPPASLLKRNSLMSFSSRKIPQSASSGFANVLPQPSVMVLNDSFASVLPTPSYMVLPPSSPQTAPSSPAISKAKKEEYPQSLKYRRLTVEST